MFNLFESRKSRTKKKIVKALDVYIPGIEGLDPEEIGMMLDQAQFIKESSLILLDQNDPAKAYWEDPWILKIFNRGLEKTPPDFCFEWCLLSRISFVLGVEPRNT